MKKHRVLFLLAAVGCALPSAPRPHPSGLAGVWTSTDSSTVLHHVTLTLRDSGRVVVGQWEGYVRSCSRQAVASCYRSGAIDSVSMKQAAVAVYFQDALRRTGGNGWAGIIQATRNGSTLSGTLAAATPFGQLDTEAVQFTR